MDQQSEQMSNEKNEKKIAPLTWEQIRNELEVELSKIEPGEDPDYRYLDGFKHGMIAVMCLQHGWAELPQAEQVESAKLQKWLVEVCAK